ncbi:helix-turn-helix domain-containing protein [Jiella mangrovi]|uniref:Helix-turn-helix transcriptional regulator n=1 Tax=Jiella mangrovi TaxID=2821407 RepID=A0ABS4BNS2_9HYPH|nr:helix-turn-helix transcriptional regulator [Jiella mangrovi]MBP0617809.1 helix-turn-helix transcriptional regulator [Jiella mangrovi]
MAKTKTGNTIDAAVGGRIRMHRLAQGMSQTALARALGVTFQQVQKHEKGTNQISVSRLQKVADVFDLPPSAFFDDAAALKIDAGGLASFVQSPEGLELNSAFATISDRDVRRGVVRLVEAIVKDASAQATGE